VATAYHRWPKKLSNALWSLRHVDPGVQDTRKTRQQSQLTDPCGCNAPEGAYVELRIFWNPSTLNQGRLPS